jgi:hypothetical protein
MTGTTRPVTRETPCAMRGRSILVTLHGPLIRVRLKGTRLDRYDITARDLFELLEWREAKRKAREIAASVEKKKKKGRR